MLLSAENENDLSGSVGLDTTAFKTGVSDLKAQVKQIEASFRASAAVMGDWSKSTEGLGTRTTSLKDKLKLQKQALATLNEEYKKAASEQGADSKSAQSLANQMYSMEKQISSTERDLKKYNDQLKLQSSRFEQLHLKMQNVSKQAKAIGSNLSSFGKSMTTKVTVPIVAVGVAASKMGMDFEKSSAKVSTIADTASVSMASLKNGVLALSSQTGESASDLNEALYQAISAGVKTGDAMQFLGTAIKLAKGGFTDSQTAIDALTTTINAYGLKASDATKISDQLIQTQNLGKTTVAELGGAIGNVIPIAASMNVSTQDLFASLAELTKNGVKTDEAVTGMKSALSSILSPSASAAKAAKQMGINFSEAHLKNVGWPAFLQEIQEKTGGSSEKMAELFGNVRALNAVTILAGKGSSDFKTVLQQMGGAAGTTDSAFAKMEDNGAAKWEKAVNKMKSAGIKLGESLTPLVAKISDVVSGLADKFNSLSPAQQSMIINFAKIAAIIGPIVLILGKLIAGAGALAVAIGTFSGALAVAQTGAAAATPAIAGLATAMSAPILPILGVTAAIAGLVIGIKALMKHFQSSSIETKKLGSNVSASTQKAVTAFNDLDQKADKSLKELAITGKTVTKTMADDIKKNIDGMANQTIAGFQKQRDESIKAIQDLATKGSGITQKQMQQMISNVNVGYKQRITSEQFGQSKIDKILQSAASKHRGLTKQESDQISTIKSQMYSNGVKALSKNQVEEQAIYDNMRVNHTATSAQEAASIVKDSKATTDKVIGDANQKYKDTVSAIERERDETHTISSDQADKLIKAAKKQRDDSVSAAQGQHQKVVAEAKKQAGEQVNQVDWTNGQVKSKWQVFQGNWSSFWSGWSGAAKRDFNGFKKSAVKLWDDIKSSASKKWDNIKSGWTGFWSGFQSKVQSGLDTLKSNWSTFWSHIGDAITNLNPAKWGKDLIDGIANGIKSAADHVKTAVGNVAQNIRDYLHFSVPDVGPLSDADTYGLDFMQLLADTISKNSDKPADAAKAAAQLVAQHIQQVKTDLAKALNDINTRSQALNAEETKALQNATAEQRAAIQTEYDQKRQALSEEAALRKRQADQEITEIDRIGKESKDELNQEIHDRKDFASNVNSLADEIKSDLKKKYDQEEQAQEAHINKQLNKLEDWKTKSEDTINDVYSDKIQAAENAANAATAAIQKELDALDAQKTADGRAETRKGYTDKISDLKSQIKYSHDAYNTAQLQKQLEQEQTAYQKELDSEALEDKKAALNNQMAAVKTNLDQQKAALQEEQQAELDHITKIYNARKKSLNNQLQKVKDTYSKMTEDARLEAQAEQMIMKNSQDEIITLLNSYSDTYKLTGQTLGDKLAEGFKPAIDTIKSEIASIDDAISSARNSALDALSEAKAAKVATRSRSSFTTNNNSRVNNINVNITSPRASSASQQSRQASAAVRRALFQVG